MASTNDFVMSDNTWNSPFKGFKKDQRQAQKTPSAPPQKQSGNAQARPTPQPTEQDDGSGVDFNSLPDNEKYAANLVSTRYNGSVPPNNWSMYMSQKDPMAEYQLLLKYSTYVYNYIHSQNAMRVEDTDVDQHFPWWSASRDWNPELFRGSWGPSPQMVAGISQKF